MTPLPGTVNLRDRTVVLGIGGGIAAYKACELVRLFRKSGARVLCAMTPAACRFVGPLTFQALSGEPVLTDLLSPSEDRTYGHLSLARAADLFVAAPATADLLARLRVGLGDDPVTATALAITAPRLLAPAMNTRMWESPAVRENVAALEAAGWVLVGPASGELADGDVGPGRLADPDEIARAAARLVGPRDLAGKRVLVTAGPTREPIDPVRFIGNPSSGRMGFALARAARRRGAQVVLVTGPVDLTDPPDVRTVRVVTAEEMARAVEQEVAGAHLVVCAAAVSDYRPKIPSSTKIKKGEGGETLEMVRTPDILADLGARRQAAGKKGKAASGGDAGGYPGPCVLVGFAAETDHLVENAREKIARKGCDLMAANEVGSPGSGFGGSRNRIALLGPGEDQPLWIDGSKDEVADGVLDRASELLGSRVKGTPAPR